MKKAVFLDRDGVINKEVNSKKDIVIWGAGDTGRLIKKNNFFI